LLLVIITADTGGFTVAPLAAIWREYHYKGSVVTNETEDCSGNWYSPL